MALYDMYEQFRNYRLTPDETRSLDQARQEAARLAANPSMERMPGGFRSPETGFKVHPETTAYMKIAVSRAKAQFRDNDFMPEDIEAGIRFPGVDPIDKFSVIDMKFAQREAAIRAVLESRSQRVQDYAGGLLRNHDWEFLSRLKEMRGTSIKHRTLTRASKLCKDPDGRRMLHQQALGLEVSKEVEEYDKLLQGIEYAAGVRQGPVPKEITDFYRDTLKTELDMGVVAEARSMDHVPSQIHVEFQDLEHKLKQRAFAQPRNWGKSSRALDALVDTAGVVDISEQIPPYAVATADRVIDPLFRDMEKPAPEAFRGRAAEKAGFGIDIEFSRGDLISVDGKTIRETMQEQFAASGRKGTFEDFYKQNVRQMTNELVSAGLMAGKRVEAFVPNKFGEIPKEPTQITKTGYEPSPMKKEHFNAWQRHFAKRGYYKAKVERQAEYERVMAARERMKAKAMSSEQARRHDRTEALKDAVAYNQSLLSSNPAVKNLFFGKVMDSMAPELQEFARQNGVTSEIRTFTVGEDGRAERAYGKNGFQAMQSKMRDLGAQGALSNFSRTEPVDTCVCILAAQGHSIQDIMNPNKLQTEREAAVKEFMEHAVVNDQEWFGRTTFAGQRAMLQQVDRLTRGIDLTADSSMRTLAEVEALTHAGYGANQMLDEKGAMEGYLMAAIEATGGDLEAGSRFGEAQSHRLCDVAITSQFLFKGLQAQNQLADPSAQANNLTVSTLATAQMIRSRFNPGASFVDQALTSEQASACNAAAQSSGVDEKNPASLAHITKPLISPQNRAVTARAAASGKLADILSGGELKMTPITGRGAKSHDIRDAMVRQPDGTLVKQRTTFEKQNYAVSASFSRSAQAAKELVEPGKAGPQVQAKQKAAPQKQAPQAGGLKL